MAKRQNELSEEINEDLEVNEYPPELATEYKREIRKAVATERKRLYRGRAIICSRSSLLTWIRNKAPPAYGPIGHVN
jgi:hypothetical protein